MERLEYDLLFRWLVRIGVDAAVWDHSVFSKNRDRLLEGDIATRFLAAVLDQPRVKELLSTEHFTVDGTLIEAWASLKSFKPRDGSDDPTMMPAVTSNADFNILVPPSNARARRPGRAVEPFAPPRRQFQRGAELCDSRASL